MWNLSEDLVKSIQKQPWAQACKDPDFWRPLLGWVRDFILPEFLSDISNQVDEIIDINPDLSDPEILTLATRSMVQFLEALSASVRIYDPNTEQMLSYGSYPYEEPKRVTYIPLENTLAGEVVKTRKPYLVPNIIEEKLYQDKDRVIKKGAYSIMAIPLAIPRFFPDERDTVGVIQIYFRDMGRTFTPLEIQMAELMARRLSFVVARKKLLSMHKINEKKDVIVQKVFMKLGSRGGVKMKDVFNRVIPELADIINVQSCALFTLMEDRENVLLEAGYPEQVGYHGIGKSFPVKSEPAFELVLRRRDYDRQSPFEVVTRAYVLIMDPMKSEYISKNLKQFAAAHNINSILYVPLNEGEDVTNFMTFDAREQRKRYDEGEIEIFLFLGRELLKAQRMEHLDDTLHDFKNPAIATAGFARRLKRMLDQGNHEKDFPTVKKYVEILFEETTRLQEMALSIYHVGKEQIVNLTEVFKKRFEINKEAIREMLKQNVTLREGPFEESLRVQCYPLQLERILDNLLNNATNAIPLHGGTLSIRTYPEDNWACSEVTNTGAISEEERLRLLEGEGEGRGLYITHRIIRTLKGKIDVRTAKDTTTVILKLPRVAGEAAS
jgi:signal transduction histidine kinase